MKILILLRHAKAERSMAEDDLSRQLTRKGRKAARRAGRVLCGLSPQMALCSPAERTLATAKHSLASLGNGGRLVVVDQLYLTDLAAHLAQIVRVSDLVDRLLLVGHNPTLEELVGHLTGGRRVLRPGSLAILAIPIGSWGDLAAASPSTLVGVVSAADLCGQTRAQLARDVGERY